jgi:hypothetical protein
MGDKSRNIVPVLLLLLLSLLFDPVGIGRVSSAVVVDDGTLSDWDNVTVSFTDALGDSPIDMTDLVFVAFDFDDTWLYVRWDIDNDGTKPAVLYDMGINITASGITWDIFVAAQIERISGTPVLTNISIRDAGDAHIWNATDDGSMIEDGTLYFDPPPGGTPGTISVEARFPLSYIASTTGLIFSQFRSHSSIQVTSNEKDLVPDGGYIILSLDDDPPELTNLSDTPDPQSAGGNVNITVDVTDDHNVESVWVNITYPDSSWANMSMMQGSGNEWFLNTTYLDPGLYSYAVWANDSSDNWNTTGPGTFDITGDFSLPELSNLLDFPDPQIPGGNVNITVDVTDNIGVSSVWVNITFPDATWNNVTMTKGSGDGWYFNTSYSDLGSYSYTVWANDTSDNWNSSGPGTFTIQDIDGPLFSNLDDDPDPQENGGYVNLTVDVTDNVAVDMVWINITYPDASWVNVSMTQGTGDEWYYNTSYADLGVYTYTIFANDTNDNWNTTGPETFTIQDTDGPLFSNLDDAPDPQENGGNVNISVDVTDDVGVNEVWVNVTYPDSSWINVSMSSGTGDEWYFNAPYNDLGSYSYTVWAKDTSNNWNSTGPGTFTIQDTDGLVLSNLDDTPDPQENGGFVNITVDVTDDVGVDNVWVNITFPDSSWTNVSMNKGSMNEWSYDASYSDLGIYSYTIWANDTSDNWASTGPGTFTIQDTDGPEFSNLDDAPDPQENDGYVNITVDVTDDVGVDEVWVNVTYPDATWINVSMIPSVGNEWFTNNTYADLGSYSYTVWANDTSNNWNYSGPSTFTIEDTDGPFLTNLNDAPDPQEYGGFVNVTVDVTDDIGVNEVWVNITYPDATWVNISMIQGAVNEWFYETTYNDLGVYSYSVWAKDTSSNWNSTGPGTFTIQDTNGPEFEGLKDTPDPQDIGGYVNITVNITDSVGVGEVWINITYPNGSWLNISMLHDSGDGWYYNSTFIDQGIYSYTVWANDTSSNWNNSIPGGFEIKGDTSFPVLSNLNDFPDPQVPGGFVNITVDVSDDTAVDEVWVNVTYPNGSSVNISMTQGAGDEWFYNTSYLDSGMYTCLVWANDTSSNWNSSDSGGFEIKGDTSPPVLSNLNAFPDPQVPGGFVNITVDVTDDTAVDGVWVNVTYPDGSTINISMSKGAGNEWFHDTTYMDSGMHTYIVWANDTSNNWNSTGPGTFTIQDSIDPELGNLDATPNPQENDGNVNITVDVTDDVGVDEVWVNITYPDGSWINVTMTQGPGDEWFYDSTYANLGVYSYTVWANDTSNNWNSIGPQTFTIEDTDGPVLTNLLDTPDPQENGGYVNITVDVIDDVGVDGVWVNITYPDSSWLNMSMENGIGDEWFFNTSFLDLGIHSYTVWSKDTSSNWNTTGPGTFTIQDTDGPVLNNVLDFPDPQEYNGFVNITVDVTDDVGVNEVWINITYPNSSWINVSMDKGVGDGWFYYNSYVDLGVYSYTIWANDTSDNRNGAGPYEFVIQDTDGPEFSNLVNSPDPQEINGYVNVTVDVTDDFAVDEVWINISFPNGTWINVSMDQGTVSGWYHNESYPDLGTHIYTIWANDTNGNWNKTGSFGFDIKLDIIPPVIWSADDFPDPQLFGGYVNITVNATDNVGVDSVWLNITGPLGMQFNATLIWMSANEWFYNTTYSVVGVFTYTAWVNDTSDNRIVFGPGTFTIIDIYAPELNNLIESPDPQENGGFVNISVSVVDDVAVDDVWINISYPDSSWINTSMTKGVGDEWFFNGPYSELGLYTYIIWAKDTSNNLNCSWQETFTIHDTDGPEFIDVYDFPDPQENGGFVNITAEIIDDVDIDEVWINVTYPDTTWINVSMDKGATDEWYYNTSYLDLGIYSYTILAKDTSDNWNYSSVNLFTIQDTDGPHISDLDANPDIQISEGHVNISVSVIDDIAVYEVFIIIPYPDGGQINASMNRGIGDKWYYNITYSEPGIFSFTVFANDTSNNWNSSETLAFEILGYDYPPIIWPPNAFPDPQQVGQLVNITVRVTDEIGVDEVWVNIIYPGGTWQNLSMFPSNSNGWYYRNAYLALNDYYYIIWAKDVGGQWNSSGANTFTIYDILPPIIDNINDTPDPAEIGEPVNISVDVFDDVAVGEVWIDIRYPNGTWINVSMESDGIERWYTERSYPSLGLYLYVIWATDISGNWISSDSETFVIQDTEGPIIIDTYDGPNILKENEEINITVEVFDNVGINGVWINISFPDGRWLIVSMDPGLENEWYYTTDFDITGEFSYTILAVDSSSNWNITEPEIFRVEPQEAPPKIPRFAYMMLLLIYWPLLLILFAVILVRSYEPENRMKKELIPILASLNNYYAVAPKDFNNDLRNIKDIIIICQRMGIPIEEFLLTLHNEGNVSQIKSSLSNLLLKE